jgi:hypothetical protein
LRIKTPSNPVAKRKRAKSISECRPVQNAYLQRPSQCEEQKANENNNPKTILMNGSLPVRYMPVLIKS